MENPVTHVSLIRLITESSERQLEHYLMRTVTPRWTADLTRKSGESPSLITREKDHNKKNKNAMFCLEGFLWWNLQRPTKLWELKLSGFWGFVNLSPTLSCWIWCDQRVSQKNRAMLAKGGLNIWQLHKPSLAVRELQIFQRDFYDIIFPFPF